MANIKISDYGYEIQVIAEPGGIVILREGDKCFNEVRSMLPYIRRLIEEVKSEPKPAEKSIAERVRQVWGFDLRDIARVHAQPNISGMVCTLFRDEITIDLPGGFKTFKREELEMVKPHT